MVKTKYTRKKKVDKTRSYRRVENVQKSIRQNYYAFKRIDQQGPIISSTTGVASAWTFSMDTVPGYTELTTLFDQYMILGVRVELRPQFGKDAIINTNYGVLYTTIDYDDNLPPTLTDIQQERLTRQHTLSNNRPIVRYVRPTTLTRVYRSALTTGYAVNGRKWLSCDYPDIPHYSFKTLWEGCTANGFPINVSFIYFIAMKNPR